jgi:hypothetical protein
MTTSQPPVSPVSLPDNGLVASYRNPAWGSLVTVWANPFLPEQHTTVWQTRDGKITGTSLIHNVDTLVTTLLRLGYEVTTHA